MHTALIKLQINKGQARLLTIQQHRNKLHLLIYLFVLRWSLREKIDQLVFSIIFLPTSICQNSARNFKTIINASKQISSGVDLLTWKNNRKVWNSVLSCQVVPLLIFTKIYLSYLHSCCSIYVNYFILDTFVSFSESVPPATFCSTVSVRLRAWSFGHLSVDRSSEFVGDWGVLISQSST